MAARGEARDLLLAAGSALFAERGFAGTTTRDVAERAGVDAALIVRYFGGKVGLYLASLQSEDDGTPAPLLQTERMLGMLGRVDTAGPGPVFQAALQVHPDDAVQTATRQALHHRVVDPLRGHYDDGGRDRAQLRAELLAAAFAGIALGRASGAFPELAQAPAEDVVALVQEAFAEVRTR
jgi:AcrR family transcriptional regulator